MNSVNPVALFSLLLRASLLSFSGMGNLPSVRADLIDARHWATDRELAEALAVGQIAPGPTGLWVVSLAFRIDGLRGAMLAVIALCIPPLLVLPMGKIYARTRNHPAVDGFVTGLGAAVVGIFTVMMFDVFAGAGAPSWRGAATVLATIALGATRRIPVIVLLALAAMVGILWR